MATDSAVAHYQAQAKMAYDDWLNQGNPHENDDGGYSQEEADEEATTQVMQSGYELALELAEIVHHEGKTESTDVAALCRGGYDAQDKPLHELLAVIVNAYEADDVKAAAFELRERLRAALAPRINEVSGELLTEHLASIYSGVEDHAD